ncbi:hypothetical protein IEQ34_012069 [Dendrobium chrysotoxum]|uniref:Uncharacterized protein n=1 Tax=Dendrobium chrysotoxum TaxID=161865 RepID=A0AAV7GBW9_DENCH|nr:hypothetical protein IEQ34_012069 [Dendrobium chrysotoxum]
MDGHIPAPSYDLPILILFVGHIPTPSYDLQILILYDGNILIPSYDPLVSILCDGHIHTPPYDLLVIFLYDGHIPTPSYDLQILIIYDGYIPTRSYSLLVSILYDGNIPIPSYDLPVMLFYDGHIPTPPYDLLVSIIYDGYIPAPSYDLLVLILRKGHIPTPSYELPVLILCDEYIPTQSNNLPNLILCDGHIPTTLYGLLVLILYDGHIPTPPCDFLVSILYDVNIPTALYDLLVSIFCDGYTTTVTFDLPILILSDVLIPTPKYNMQENMLLPSKFPVDDIRQKLAAQLLAVISTMASGDDRQRGLIKNIFGGPSTLAAPEQAIEVRMLIEPDGDTFYPSKQPTHKIQDIIWNRYDAPFLSWQKILKDVRNLWFREFEKEFCWLPQHNDRIRKNFEKRGSNRMRDMFTNLRKSGQRPLWMGESVWAKLSTAWSSLDYSRRRDQNRQNRASDFRGLGSSLHIGGSVPHTEHRRCLKAVLGREPTLIELHSHTHKRRSIQGFERAKLQQVKVLLVDQLNILTSTLGRKR